MFAVSEAALGAISHGRFFKMAKYSLYFATVRVSPEEFGL
jgi:hypothetical protein